MIDRHLKAVWCIGSLKGPKDLAGNKVDACSTEQVSVHLCKRKVVLKFGPGQGWGLELEAISDEVQYLRRDSALWALSFD